LDDNQRKEFDNTYYNHQEILKEFSELKSQIEALYGREQLMSDKIEKLDVRISDLFEQISSLSNLLKYKGTGLYETNRENQV
jgi:peptidoglycan hydrolase CwlO-like protein|tara:strand:+ start:466 stop:711 length:246 start_codon:yes stop_codon:yes gene_type:complete